MTATTNRVQNEKQAEHNITVAATSLVSRSRSTRSTSRPIHFAIYLWQYTTAKLPEASPTPQRVFDFPADTTVGHLSMESVSCVHGAGLLVSP
ncbi:hypothetical protein ON010_g3496 [Phytophthora cinnamomi]|nr:hypothetical protein ON010_g3496 [Phytophthora cinnamomi]